MCNIEKVKSNIFKKQLEARMSSSDPAARENLPELRPE